MRRYIVFYNFYIFNFLLLRYKQSNELSELRINEERGFLSVYFLRFWYSGQDEGLTLALIFLLFLGYWEQVKGFSFSLR